MGVHHHAERRPVGQMHEFFDGRPDHRRLEVAVPKQRNSREENARIKAGETPAGWKDKPANRRQKDVEARWTKKHGKSHYGATSAWHRGPRPWLVRRYHVKDAGGARAAKSSAYAGMKDNTRLSGAVDLDSAYRSALEDRGVRRSVSSELPSLDLISRAAATSRCASTEKQGNKTRSSSSGPREHFVDAALAERRHEAADAGTHRLAGLVLGAQAPARSCRSRSTAVPPAAARRRNRRPTGASRGGRVTILGEGDRLGTVLWRK